MKTLAEWKELVERIPERCGVYLFKRGKEFVYIGKAKNLKRRLLQHLQQAKSDRKELAIFAGSTHLEYILTTSEYEALVLERQLINLHKPKYNVVFKHGSGYPMLVLTEGPFPTLKIVRDFEERGTYFGPFFTVNQAKRVKKLVHQLFKLRTCEEMPVPGKLCMDYHLGLCSGPCVGKVKREDYRLAVEGAKAFLSGEVGRVLPKLYSKIEELARRMEFERCALLKEQVEALENLARGQKVLNLPFGEADVWLYLPKEEKVRLYLIRGRKLVGREEFDLSGKLHEGLASWLEAYYSVNFVPERVFYEGGEVPSRETLERFLKERSKKTVSLQRGIPEELRPLVEVDAAGASAPEEALERSFREVLKLPLPRRIEGFDVSHFMGEATVGSCVVWEKGRMKKSCYRRYRVKTVGKIDDYASLKEILTRRARRIVSGQYPVPDLWLIDGGKGQLSAALEVKERFKLPTFVVALAKREEILHTEDGREIPLKEHPELYRVFGLIRDEAHRFALGYNRLLRKKKLLGMLDERTAKLVERNFSDPYEVLRASDEYLRKLGLSPELKRTVRKVYGEEDRG
ncbi:MAG: excinuclease ABC subunit UvrC [Aquificae bacterium]|nr:excinuclease ABC subunit UvrC [Aquificota bacterium]